MNLTLKTAPAVEPVTLAEVKQMLRLNDDPGTALQTEQSIAPGTYAPGTVTGVAVDVLGMVATVQLDAGTLAAGATLDVAIQESNDNETFTTWQSFPQVTTANDAKTHVLAYTGSQRYVRAVAVVAEANTTCAVNVILSEGYTAEDELLSSYITAARQYCEDYQHRAYITQTWEMTMDDFPFKLIELPKGSLQSIDSVKYKDAAGTETTLAATEYTYSTRGVLGRLVPAYGKSWPSFTAHPVDAVTVEFTCGYGDSGADVPEKTRQAIKLLVSHWYTNREPVLTGTISKELEFSLSALLWQDRIVLV